MYKENELSNFEFFLQELKDQNYEFIFFNKFTRSRGQVIIRHDIDFDVMAALEIAKIESSMNIKATYFFLVSNGSYNPFEAQNFKAIQKIKDLGHKISLHFDPTAYSDYEKGFRLEKQLFETAFETPLEIISLHRPNAFFQNNNQTIGGCDHTYMNKYFKDMKYVSDSTGIFRYGHPFQSNEFKNNESLHILIHPIWWVLKGATNLEKLKDFYNGKKNSLKMHYSLNCEPFNNILDELT